MMARRGSVFLSLIASANLKGLEDVQKKLREVGKTSQKTNGLLSSMGGTLGALVSGAGLLAFGKSAVSAASDLNEMQSKIGQIFGQQGQADLIAWSKTASAAFGQSQTQALDAASNFGIFAKSAGMSGKSALDFSKQFTVLAADLASFNNTSVDEAITALGAGLRGENEPLRRFGVLLDDATLRSRALAMGIIQNTKTALTPQQKVLAAGAEILRQTSQAQGDYARTADGMANQQRTLTAAFEDFKASIGVPLMNALLPIFQQLTPALQNAAPQVIGIGKQFAALIAIIIRFKNELLFVGKVLAAIWVGSKVYAGVIATVRAITMLITVYKALRAASLGAAVAQALATRGVSLLGLLGAGGAIALTLAGFYKLESEFNKTNNALPNLTDNLNSAATNYQDAANALSIGAKSVNSAATNVGRATGSRKPKPTKTPLATTRNGSTTSQSFTVGASGGGLSLSVTVNGSVVQERDIARSIRDELLQFARRQGVNLNLGV